MEKDIACLGLHMLNYASDDEEDETAELMRELEKIKKERAEQREREVCTGVDEEGESHG